MKRKVIFLGLLICFSFLVGCSFKKNDNILNSFMKKVSKCSNYYLSGQLEIVNNEDVYSYNVNVAYKKDDNFRVELKNKTNEHVQIILKNNEGVFV